jgi:hypothetical protein
MTQTIGILLLAVGVMLALAGGALLLFGKIPFFGSLPGDFSFGKGNVRVSIPLASSILLSLLVTGIVWLISYFRDR